MIRVALSTSVCQRGKSGVATYIFGLLAGIAQACPEVCVEIHGLAEDRPLFERWIARGAVWREVSEFWRPAVKNVLWHQLLFPLRLRSTGADLVHIPSYRRMLLAAPCPQVATIHDCAAFHVKGKYDVARMVYGRRIVPALARRARRIITVSHATAGDVVKFFGLEESRIEVIWNGIDHNVFRVAAEGEISGFRRRAGLEWPFVLYVARLEHPGKNHLRLIEAYERMIQMKPGLPCHLVLAGADWHGAEVVRARAAASPLRERIHFPGFVPGEDLSLWYGSAELLVYPSLFEGFGLPPVEAMACGCPVVCSARGSLGEVAGGAARIVDPESPEEIAAGMVEVLESRPLWREKGLARAALFDWKDCARKTVKVYEGALGG